MYINNIKIILFNLRLRKKLKGLIKMLFVISLIFYDGENDFFYCVLEKCHTDIHLEYFIVDNVEYNIVLLPIWESLRIMFC
jgi:hypothetical protein